MATPLLAYLLRMVNSYLKSRAVLYYTLEGQRRGFVRSGASKLCIVHTGTRYLVCAISQPALARNTRKGPPTFVDDVDALIVMRRVGQAPQRLELVLRKVDGYIGYNGFSLLLSKTYIVMNTKKHILVIVPMGLGGLDTRN